MCGALSVPVPPVVAELFSLASSAQVSAVTKVSIFETKEPDLFLLNT